MISISPPENRHFLKWCCLFVCFFFLLIAGRGQMYGRGGPTYGGQAPSHEQPSAVTPPQPQSAPHGRGLYISVAFILFKQVTSSFSGQYCR